MSTTPINSITFKAVAADTNSIASSQTTSEAADLNLSSASVNDGSNMASTVTIKSLTADNSSITFNVQGTDANGDLLMELFRGLLKLVSLQQVQQQVLFLQELLELEACTE